VALVSPPRKRKFAAEAQDQGGRDLSRPPLLFQESFCRFPPEPRWSWLPRHGRNRCSAISKVPVSVIDRAMAFYTAVLCVELTRQAVDDCDMALFGGDGPVYGALDKGGVYAAGKARPVLDLAVTNVRDTLYRAVAAGTMMLSPVKDIGENTGSRNSPIAGATGCC
jgi:predicted enzyme related to lactoylglutathione lyase